jgi:signal transduction histidine kinase
VARRTALQRRLAPSVDALLYAMAQPALILDIQQDIVDINPAAMTLLNMAARPMLGHPLHRLLNVNAAAIEACCREEQSKLTVELAGAHGLRFIELRFSVLYTSERGTQTLVLLHDVTAERQHEKAREALIQSLEAYASSISHDLKAPLATMMGFASLLELNDSADDEQRHYAQVIQKSSRQLSRLVDELLLFATLEKLEDIPLEALEMNIVLHEVIQRLHCLVEEKHATLTLPTVLPVVSGYEPWVEVVLSNYVSNALKYGGECPHIIITTHEDEKRAYFFVHDNGAGLTAEQQETLFHRAARFDGRKQGHGLGLTIVRQIIERLGGEVGVQSAPGCGTSFWFSLPKAI